MTFVFVHHHLYGEEIALNLDHVMTACGRETDGEKAFPEGRTTIGLSDGNSLLIREPIKEFLKLVVKATRSAA